MSDKIRVLIDPGHGGTDRKNRGPTGYVEADGVLQISKYLRDELIKTGAFEVKLSRETDIFIGIRARGEMAAAWKADLAISEHTNATGVSPNTTVRGTEVYESVDLNDNDLADLLSSRVAKALGIPDRGGKEWKNANIPDEDHLGFIDGAQDNGVPHVLLIESAYHDNALDEALLKNDDKLRLIAYVQAGVICHLFNVRNTLKKYSGNKSAIEELQSGLKKLGYTITVDGTFGPGTEATVKKFQFDNKMTVDGIVGPTTWKKLDELLAPPAPTPEPAPNPAPAGTPIMGKSLATDLLLYSYAIKNNPSPKLSVPLLDLCKMFLEEGEAEGVRGDIAFCQSCKETGFFGYGGLARPEWNNFAGLGVTGQIGPNGIPAGEIYPDARTGVRAQIQHLKAYASKEPLVKPCVDNRFIKVTRGIAPNWEDLNGKWAVPGTTYGQDIVKMYQSIPINDIIEPPTEDPVTPPQDEVTIPTEKVNILIKLLTEIIDLLKKIFKPKE